MPLVEPGPVEKIINWFKGLSGNARNLEADFGKLAPSPEGSKVIWSKPLDRERRIEAIARDDGLFSFREMKRVTNGPDTFDVEIYASGLYDDLKIFTLATTDYLMNNKARP